MTHLPLIGITGYAGVGKSTVAAILQDRGYTVVKFAGPLKAMMRGLGFGERELEGDLKEKPHARLNGKSPRQAMQWLGTEWGRLYFGDSFWVDKAMEGAHAVLNGGGLVVIDDCRFENEARAIRDAGGVIIKVTRSGCGPINAHISDRIEVVPDVTIVNGGDVSELADAVGLALHLLRDAPEPAVAECATVV